MAGRKKPLVVHAVEFCADCGDYRDVRGTILVRVRHWSRARRCAALKLRRHRWERVRVFRPSWLVPAELPSIGEELGHRVEPVTRVAQRAAGSRKLRDRIALDGSPIKARPCAGNIVPPARPARTRCPGSVTRPGTVKDIPDIKDIPGTLDSIRPKT